MFTISPIGSCRITTPLKNGQSRHGFRLNLSRCYGYCHSPAEAVQLARFMRGEIEIPADIWPLISRSHDLGAISAQRHDPSHLYVVELASAKEITVDGVSIQLNYLRLAFNEFFSDGNRAQEFWSHAASDDRDALPDFLAREWSASEQQQDESATLGRIHLRIACRESLRRDIQELHGILPEVLFVSHVDARKPDGITIGSRSSFIKLVREEVMAQGLNFFDPTDLMEEHGQTAAIEDESTSLAHFTAPFGDALMDEWMHHFVAPSTVSYISQNRDIPAEELLKPQINAALSRGEYQRLLGRLELLQAQCETTRELLSGVSERRDEARKAFLETALSTEPELLSIDEVSEFVTKAGNLGLFDLALDFAASAPQGFQSLPAKQLIQIALLATEAGEFDDAFEFALAAFCQNSALLRARALIVDIALTEEFNLLAVLTSEQATDLLSSLPAADRLRLMELNGTAPWHAITQDWTASEILEAASFLSERGDLDQAARVLGTWRELHEQDRIRDEALVSLIGHWVACARELEHTAERIQALTMLTDACPRHPELRNAVRDFRVELVERVREAGRNGDLEQLESLAIEANLLPTPLPEFDLWRARVLFDRGEFEEVLKLGPIATDFLSERIGVWALLMRAALKANDTGQAMEFARRVIDLACGKTQNLRVEAEAVLNAEPVGT
jgi:hypothetical protein